MRQAVLVHHPLAPRWSRRAREVEQLDAHAVTREIDRLQLRAAQAEQRIGRLALDGKLVLGDEAEEVAIEAGGTFEGGHADPDVCQSLDGQDGHHVPCMLMLTLIEPVVLSAAVRNAPSSSASAKRCVISAAPMAAP